MHQALALDSIYKILTWGDRLYLHAAIQGVRSNELAQNKRLLAVLEWITDNDWQPPKTKYGHDRLLYYLEEFEYVKIKQVSPEWLPIEQYAEEYPEITEQILKLKI